MPVTSFPNRDKHIKIVLRGSKLKQEFFHHLLADFDRDWPLKPNNSFICKICNGGVYKSPRFSPSSLKSLASQISALPQGNLKLKIKSLTPAQKCFDVALAQRESERGKG